MTAGTETTERAFVLGVDGVPWGLLTDWIDAGALPNFRRLADEGALAVLESTTPPTTPTAWPSIATGVWPDKHGIYGFQRLEGDYTQRMNTREDLAQPPLWELLSPSVVGNVPMTYPAGGLEGEMAAGMISPAVNDRFAHPSDLAATVEREVPDYEIGLNWYDYAGEEMAFTEDLATLVAARRELMELLADREDWQLFFFVYTAPDRLQHLIWDEETILDHYKNLDDILGDVLEYVDRLEANLFVVSDHGFGPISKFVHLNTILEEEGLLARKSESTARSSLGRLGITKSTLLGTLKDVGLDGKRVVQSLPKSVVDRVAAQVPGDHALYDVDFSETVAFAFDPSYVYVNDTERFEQGTVSPSEVPAVKDRLASLFDSVVDPDTGERVLTVTDGEAAFPTDEHSPDLIVVAEDGYEEKTKLGPDVFTPAGSKAASHRSEGVFFARGPGIEATGHVADLSVVDVAPTVLHSVGEPVPENVDGEARTDVLASSVAPETRAVESTEDDADGETGEEDFEDVEKRLRGLGYME